jgi:hypothetical protein
MERRSVIPDSEHHRAVARMQYRLRLLAGLILAAGWISAAWTWRAQDEVDRQNANRDPRLQMMAPGDSARYTRQVEIYYGKTGLLTDRGLRALEELTHGKSLAMALAGGSFLVALGLFASAAIYPLMAASRASPGNLQTRPGPPPDETAV